MYWYWKQNWLFASLKKAFKIQLNDKRLNPTDSVKYLGVRIDNKLNWKEHVNDITMKLIRANAILHNIRDFVNKDILKSVYFFLFYSHINYASVVWKQNINT